MWLDRRSAAVVAILIATLSICAPSAAVATYPRELYKQDPEFRKAIRTMLGRKPVPWLAALKGVQPPIEYIAAGANGEEHLLIRVCKPHNCVTDRALILYSPKRGVAYGKLQSGGGVTTLGTPGTDIAAEIEGRFKGAR